MKEKDVKKEFKIASDFSQIQDASARVMDFLQPLALTESHAFDVRLCLEEALINAVKHGNKCDPALSVRLAVDYDTSRICFVVEDEGSGFSPDRVEDCTREDNILKSRGRGVFLIKNIMDEVTYNEKGNSLRMIKRLK